MVNEKVVIETDAILQSKPKISKLAIVSVVFGILGPFAAGTMWCVSRSYFLNTERPLITSTFSYSIAWILGLALGIKSLEQINCSEGQLHGKEYAIVGVVTSIVWMLLVLVCFILPSIFSVNS